MKEITIEITDYCPHNCRYCSSNSTKYYNKTTFIEPQIIIDILEEEGIIFDRINISGGEPLAHPKFYQILEIVKDFAKDVVVYTNALTHIRYNANVIDSVYLEANITLLPETDKIHILRRVKQGKEANRPEVHLSRNFKEDCSCDHRVIRPNGKIGKTPCNKWVEE